MEHGLSVICGVLPTADWLYATVQQKTVRTSPGICFQGLVVWPVPSGGFGLKLGHSVRLLLDCGGCLSCDSLGERVALREGQVDNAGCDPADGLLALSIAE